MTTPDIDTAVQVQFDLPDELYLVSLSSSLDGLRAYIALSSIGLGLSLEPPQLLLDITGSSSLDIDGALNRAARIGSSTIITSITFNSPLRVEVRLPRQSAQSMLVLQQLNQGLPVSDEQTLTARSVQPYMGNIIRAINQASPGAAKYSSELINSPFVRRTTAQYLNISKTISTVRITSDDQEERILARAADQVLASVDGLSEFPQVDARAVLNQYLRRGLATFRDANPEDAPDDFLLYMPILSNTLSNRTIINTSPQDYQALLAWFASICPLWPFC